MKLPEPLASSEYAPLVVGLLAVAWADGKITSEERSLIRALLDEIEVALSQTEFDAWLATKPSADWVGSRVVDPIERRFLIRQALLLSREDGELAAAEADLVDRWARTWQFSNDDLRVIEQEVSEFLKRRFVAAAQ